MFLLPFACVHCPCAAFIKFLTRCYTVLSEEIGTVVPADSVNRFNRTRREQSKQKCAAVCKPDTRSSRTNDTGEESAFICRLATLGRACAVCCCCSFRLSILYQETEAWTADFVLVVSHFGFPLAAMNRSKTRGPVTDVLQLGWLRNSPFINVSASVSLDSFLLLLSLCFSSALTLWVAVPSRGLLKL